jgi:hypothetical protein
MKMKEDSLGEKIRDVFSEFVSDYFELPLGNLTDKQRSEGLIRFYIEKIHNVRSSQIDEDDINSGIVDGPNDLGADFIYRDNNQVWIIQSKYHNRKSDGAKLEEIEHLQSFLNRLRNKDFKQNSALSEIADSIDFKNDEFHLLFLCLGKIGGQAEKQTKVLLPLEEDLAYRVDIEFWDEARIAEEYRNVSTIGRKIEDIKGTIFSSPLSRKNRTPIIKLETHEGNSYILVTEATQIIQIYNQKAVKDNLFSLNIRNYLGNNKNNQGIIETAKENPEKFFFFYNGISCLAKEVYWDVSNQDRVEVVGLQVINGAQTVKALVKAAKFFKDKLPLILVRITELEKGYGEEGHLREDIIKYNNTQTTIKSSDFRSNDPVQEDLKKKFSQITKEGKRVIYINKRTDPAIQRAGIKIKMEDFAKVIYSFLGDYTDFAKNTNFLFDIEKKGYKTVFGDGEEVFVREMPQEQFEIRAGIWWVSESFDSLRKEKRKKIKEKDKETWNALERKWLLLYVARKILENSHQEKMNEWLRKGYKGDWEIEESKYRKGVHKLFEASASVIVLRYKEDRKNPKFDHREWFRRNETKEDLDSYSEIFGVKIFSQGSD